MASGSGQNNAKPFRLSGASLMRSGAWVAADNWSQQILQFLCFIYVGNLIGPAAIGLMTVALTYMLLMHALLMNAFTNVIVQRENVTEAHYNTAFWVNAGLGLAAMIVSALAAPLIAWSLGEPLVEPLIQALSPMCLAMGLVSFYEAKIRRELRFNALAGRSILSVGAGFGVAVFMAMEGFGVWSLVAYQLTWRLVELIFVVAVAHWRPTGFISRAHLGDLLDFSLHSIGIRLVDFFAQNIGRIMIGYFLGMHALGIYQLARRFVEAPLFALSGVFQGLSLPVFSRLQDNKAELAQYFVGSIQFASFLVMPAFAGLFLVAPVLIPAFLKPEWHASAFLIQLFCLMGITLSIAYFFSTAMLALGRASTVFRLDAILLLVRILLLAAFAQFGLQGVAIAELCVVVAGFAVFYLLLRRSIPISLSGMTQKIIPSLFATVAMALMVIAFHRIAAPHLGLALLSVGMIATGVASFATVAFLTSTRELVALRKFVQRSA